MGEISQEYLKSIINYDPIEGTFTWLPREGSSAFNAKLAGKDAGYRHPSGYTYIKLTLECGSQKAFGAHRLAYLYMEGYIPTKVDHKDLDKSNNKWMNLRAATSVQNAANRKTYNRLGIKNIEVTKNNTFKVTITKGVRVFRKTLKTLEEALWYRDTLLVALHGEFATLDTLDIPRIKPKDIPEDFYRRLLSV